MFRKVYSAGIRGVQGYLVSVETDVSDGLPGFSMVGYLASEVREAEHRVRTALRNSGFRLPAKHVTVNLSPAGIRKEGTVYDLPIAVAVLAAYGIIEPEILSHVLIAGELGLDGGIKEVRGILPMVLAAHKAGIMMAFLPEGNGVEGTAVKGMKVAGVSMLKELVELLNNAASVRFLEYDESFLEGGQEDAEVDFADVNGQLLLRRATEVAAAGRHNILYIGPAGTGKSMVARRIPTIWSPLTTQEKLEISKVYSVCGLLPASAPLLSKRPFRSPHHTATPQALAGGGRIPMPGEISLASGGVLFLDELAEFSRNSLEILRQPLEERQIRISRVHGAYEFPADLMLVAATNPCPCGNYPDLSRCTCTFSQVQRYQSRISKPFLERMDILVESAPVTYEEMQAVGRNEDSARIRERVVRAQEIQKHRFRDSDHPFNSCMTGEQIREYCWVKEEEREFLKQIFQTRRLSARSYEKILKLARTIADLQGEEHIEKGSLAEAVSYHSSSDRFWIHRT